MNNQLSLNFNPKGCINLQLLIKLNCCYGSMKLERQYYQNRKFDLKQFMLKYNFTLDVVNIALSRCLKEEILIKKNTNLYFK